MKDEWIKHSYSLENEGNDTFVIDVIAIVKRENSSFLT